MTDFSSIESSSAAYKADILFSLIEAGDEDKSGFSRCVRKHSKNISLIKNHDDESLLYTACKFGRLETIRLLTVVMRADITFKNPDGLSCLDIACCRGHLDVVNFLVLVADINCLSVDKNGWTPLHLVCKYGHLKMAIHLISEANATLHILSNDGFDALTIARQNSNKDIVDYIIGHTSRYHTRAEHETSGPFTAGALPLEFINENQSNELNARPIIQQNQSKLLSSASCMTSSWTLAQEPLQVRRRLLSSSQVYYPCKFPSKPTRTPKVFTPQRDRNKRSSNETIYCIELHYGTTELNHSREGKAAHMQENGSAPPQMDCSSSVARPPVLSAEAVVRGRSLFAAQESGRTSPDRSPSGSVSPDKISDVFGLDVLSRVRSGSTSAIGIGEQLNLLKRNGFEMKSAIRRAQPTAQGDVSRDTVHKTAGSSLAQVFLSEAGDTVTELSSTPVVGENQSPISRGCVSVIETAAVHGLNSDCCFQPALPVSTPAIAEARLTPEICVAKAAGTSPVWSVSHPRHISVSDSVVDCESALNCKMSARGSTEHLITSNIEALESASALVSQEGVNQSTADINDNIVTSCETARGSWNSFESMTMSSLSDDTQRFQLQSPLSLSASAQAALVEVLPLTPKVYSDLREQIHGNLSELARLLQEMQGLKVSSLEESPPPRGFKPSVRTSPMTATTDNDSGESSLGGYVDEDVDDSESSASPSGNTGVVSSARCTPVRRNRLHSGRSSGMLHSTSEGAEFRKPRVLS